MKLKLKNVKLPIMAAISGFVLALHPAYANDDRSQGIELPQPYESVSLTTRGFVREVEFPQILSASDVNIYRKIFEVQEAGRWQEADRLIKRLASNVLLGHVLAQRYLHPTKYRSKYKELKEWSEAYNDLPDAPRLYRLALRRKPANWRAPTPPKKYSSPTAPIRMARLKTPVRALSAGDRSKVRSLMRHMRSALRRGHTLTVKRALNSKEAKRLLSDVQYDQFRARLGQAYFSAGRDEWALQWAGEAAKRSGKYVAQAHWTAGLASWRLGDKRQAADFFAKAAQLSRNDDWFHAAASFWAGRAYLVTRQPEKVNRFFHQAAENGRTFYGMLARRVLGQKTGLNWALPSLDGETVGHLETLPGGRRAIALLQIGDVARAERELRNLALGADEKVAKGILALAARGNMASLAVRLDHQLYPNGGGFDGAAYPIPAWTPGEGFRVDRALIYALIRQESKFNPNAKSWAGARGLMQLMPRTASFVAQDRQYRSKRNTQLYEPEVNMNLGQKYIEMLLEDKNIDGSLFLMAVAWNGGPGNLSKWRKSTEYMDDPLFFIESIPARETRNFVEHVLSNLWIYRDRLGQPSPSLDAIASGHWPKYIPLGQDSLEVAETNGT